MDISTDTRVSTRTRDLNRQARLASGTKYNEILTENDRDKSSRLNHLKGSVTWGHGGGELLPLGTKHQGSD